jgi:integrase
METKNMPPTADLKDDKVLMNFLASQNKGTRGTYKSFLKIILQFTATKGLTTGQQILDDKKADKDNHWQQWILEFRQWMKQQKNSKGRPYSDNAIRTALNPLRTFFSDNNTPLVFTSSQKRKLNGRAQRVETDYILTNETINKMASVGDLKEKYIVLLGKSLGFRASDFIRLTFGRFRTLNLDQEPPIFIGKIQTIKEGIDAHPFIDADALPIIKLILDCTKDKLSTDRIITVQEEELSSTIQKLAKKANIDIGDQHLRFHCFRKYLINVLSKSTSESQWKQIVGKANPEEPYVNDSNLREIYLKAMKFTTCINTNGNGKTSKLSEEITELKNELESYKKITKGLLNESSNKDLEIAKMKQQLTKIDEKQETISQKLDEWETFAKEFEKQRNENPEQIKLLDNVNEAQQLKIDIPDLEEQLRKAKERDKELEKIIEQEGITTNEQLKQNNKIRNKPETKELSKGQKP